MVTFKVKYSVKYSTVACTLVLFVVPPPPRPTPVVLSVARSRFSRRGEACGRQYDATTEPLKIPADI